jgi:hypothetical protein
MLLEIILVEVEKEEDGGSDEKEDVSDVCVTKELSVCTVKETG